jgi:hypothetical protein
MNFSRPFFIIICSSTMILNQQVSTAQAQEWCDCLAMPLLYFEASALSGRGVAEAFSMMANVMAQSDFPQEKKKVKPARYTSSILFVVSLLFIPIFSHTYAYI